MKTEIVYSAQKTNFLPGVRYANPRYFVGPRHDVTSVIIVGNWPNVADAYQFANPEMTVAIVETPEALTDYLDRRVRVLAQNPAPGKEEDDDMRFERGSPEHAAYWKARRTGMNTRDAIAAAEAQRAQPGAVAKAPAKSTVLTSDYSTDPKPVETVEAAAPAMVDIPDDWRDMIWPRLRALASKVSETPVSNRADCERAIEAELARRDRQD
jgi:hypothetical protein